MLRKKEYDRFNGKHSCGAFFSTLVKNIPTSQAQAAPDLPGRKLTFVTEHGTYYPERDFGDTGALLYLCRCGKWAVARKVLGKLNPKKKCNAKCLAATGFTCDCECGGKNHWASHDLEPEKI